VEEHKGQGRIPQPELNQRVMENGKC